MNYDEIYNLINKIIDSHKESFENFKKDEADKKSIKEGKKKGDDSQPEKIDEINDAFLEIGMLLHTANEELNTTEYKKLKSDILSKTTNNPANLNKVIKIAGHKGIKDNKDKLPKGWGTLAIISQLKDIEFENFITHPKISPNTPRSEISKIVKECQGKEVIKGITITVDSKVSNFKSREAMIDFLGTELKKHGWKVSVKPTPKIETTSPNNQNDSKPQS